MSQRHESPYRWYSVSTTTATTTITTKPIRARDYGWYIPTVLVFGLCLTGLFTYINVAISGFDLVLETTFEPNVTIAQRSQDAWASWNILTNKIRPRPKCMPAHLSRYDSFFTNQTALLYTLTAVWTEQDTHMTSLPSLTYQNNILEDCSVVSIGVEFEEVDETTGHIFYDEWNTAVRTHVSCQIRSPLGTVFFNLTQTYNSISPSTLPSRMKGRSSDSEFLTHDKQTRASLGWGGSLMSNYWGYFTWSMQQYRKQKTNAGEHGIKKGKIYLTPTDLAEDLADINFFTSDYCFTVAGRNGTGFKYIRPGRGDEDSTTLGELNRRRVYPDIWVLVDTLAKAAYSTVLADLGQTETPNILNNETALQYFTANFTTVHKYLSTDRFGPEHVPFDAKRSSSGPLRVVPSVITTPYTCQVPQYKPMGELVLSIIIADLVLLQVAWQLFKAWVWTVINSHGTAEQGHTLPNPLSVDSTSPTGDFSIRASMYGHNSQRVPDAPGRPASFDTVLQPPDIIPLTTLSGQEHGPPVPQHAADAATSLAHGSYELEARGG